MSFKVRALLIIGVTFALLVLAFVWMVVLDKATIEISGEGIYSVSVSGDRLKGVKNVTCADNPCVVVVPSGRYTLDLTRQGYRDERRMVEMTRGATETVPIEFFIIPKIEAIGLLSEADVAVKAAFDDERKGELFSMDTDPQFKKQRLNFYDAVTETWTVWAYFDRALAAPQVFPAPDLTRAVVAGDNDLYLVDGVKFERSFVGTFPGIDSFKWNPNGTWGLARTQAGEASAWWLVNVTTGTIKEWPFDFEPNKVVWSDDRHLVFATRGDVQALVNHDPQSTVDVLKSLLNGTLVTETGAFQLGEYDVETGLYRALDVFSKESEVFYDSIQLGVNPHSEKVYITDGKQLFEVVR